MFFLHDTEFLTGYKFNFNYCNSIKRKHLRFTYSSCVVYVYDDRNIPRLLVTGSTAMCQGQCSRNDTLPE